MCLCLMTHLPVLSVLVLSVDTCINSLWLLFVKACLSAVNVFPQKGDSFLYLHRLNPNTLQRYRLEREEPGLSPLSFSASYRDKHICLLYLCKHEFPVQIYLISLLNSTELVLARCFFLKGKCFQEKDNTFKACCLKQHPQAVSFSVRWDKQPTLIHWFQWGGISWLHNAFYTWYQKQAQVNLMLQKHSTINKMSLISTV